MKVSYFGKPKCLKKDPKDYYQNFTRKTANYQLDTNTDTLILTGTFENDQEKVNSSKPVMLSEIFDKHEVGQPYKVGFVDNYHGDLEFNVPEMEDDAIVLGEHIEKINEYRKKYKLDFDKYRNNKDVLDYVQAKRKEVLDKTSKKFKNQKEAIEFMKQKQEREFHEFQEFKKTQNQNQNQNQTQNINTNSKEK